MFRRLFHYFAFFGCCFLATVLSGCQHLPGEFPPSSVPAKESEAPVMPPQTPSGLPETPDIRALAAFVHWLYQQPVRNLQPLHERAESQVAAEASSLNKVNLALLLSVREMPFYDHEKALALFASVESEAGAGDDLKTFAQLEKTHLLDRLALDRHWRLEVAEERQRRLVTEKKLEELKSIDLDRRQQ
jgi:hypothetical protein